MRTIARHNKDKFEAHPCATLPIQTMALPSKGLEGAWLLGAQPRSIARHGRWRNKFGLTIPARKTMDKRACWLRDVSTDAQEHEGLHLPIGSQVAYQQIPNLP